MKEGNADIGRRVGIGPNTGGTNNHCVSSGYSVLWNPSVSSSAHATVSLKASYIIRQ